MKNNRVGKQLIIKNHTMKLIQALGKSIYANRWKIRKNMPSNLSFVISGN